MTKPILLLVPGLTCDDAVWRAQTRTFGGAYDVRIPDLSGFDSFDAMADAVLALATAQPFALAGHSMGGRVAMQVAARAPGQVQRLALLDTGAHLPTPGEAESRMSLVAIGEREGIEAVIRTWLPPMLAPANRENRALWDEISAMQRRAGVETLKRQQHALLNRRDGFAQLDTVRVPTAFITGALDGWASPEQHRDMQAHVRGSTLTVIEDCGHMAPMEAPEAINAAFAEWLAREPG
jgi:pimeloyl-ACP methyl ester carboxylesterase